MSHIDKDHCGAVIEARVRSAQHSRLEREVRSARREARRDGTALLHRSRTRLVDWSRRAVRALATWPLRPLRTFERATAPPAEPAHTQRRTDTSDALAEALDRVAYRIASRGTWSEVSILTAMAQAAREICPGAAAALVAWDGTEITRLRAFGVVHGELLRTLAPGERSRLLATMSATADFTLAA